MADVTPFLWFDGNAEEAVNLYVSIFDGARITSESRTGHGPDSPLQSATFEIGGRPYIAFNGGPYFTFNEAISLFVGCETQEEVDTYWRKLSEGGQVGRCGWLKDRFGLSWQIVPEILLRLLQDEDPEKSARVHAAMMTMNKIDIAQLHRASEGG